MDSNVVRWILSLPGYAERFDAQNNNKIKIQLNKNDLINKIGHDHEHINHIEIKPDDIFTKVFLQ